VSVVRHRIRTTRSRSTRATRPAGGRRRRTTTRRRRSNSTSTISIRNWVSKTASCDAGSGLHNKLKIGREDVRMFGQQISSRLPVSRRRTIAAVAVLAALAATPAWDLAGAQGAYPDKPVKIMVGLPAGSFIDLSARWVAEELRT